MAEVVFFPALLGVVLASLALVVNRFRRGPGGARPGIRYVSISLLVPLLFCLLACVASVLYRFSPSWKPVREGIRRYGDSVLIASGGNRSRVLTRSEFIELQLRFIPTPVEVELRGFGIVHLRMAHAIYPYIGVDFGEGRNALFDPATMICTYSD